MITQLKSAAAPSAAASERRDVAVTVGGIIADIRARGDAAVREYSERFDRWSPPSFRLDADEIERIVAGVPAQVLDDIAHRAAERAPLRRGPARQR